MRVLQFLCYTSLGGVENATRDLFAALEIRGHENVVIVDGHLLAGLEQPGRTVHRLAGLNARRLSKDVLERVSAIVEGGACDVALIHTTLHPVLAERILRRVPTVYFAHTYDAFCPGGALLYERTDAVCVLRGVPDWRCLANAYLQKCNTRRPTSLLRRYRRTIETGRWVRRADAMACDSEYVRCRHVENGFSPDRVHVLPTPVPIPPRGVLADRQREATILFVGRVTPQKGLRYLIRAFAEIRVPCTLVVAGDGYELPKVRRLAAALGVAGRIAFLGELNREALSALYLRAAVVAVPSVWPEPWGMVGPEAMSYGVPVVASKVGGIPEWLADGETGYLLAGRDVRALAGRLELLLRDPALGLRLGMRGREVAEERFGIDRHVDRLLDLFTGVVQQRGSAHGGSVEPGSDLARETPIEIERVTRCAS